MLSRLKKQSDIRCQSLLVIRQKPLTVIGSNAIKELAPSKKIGWKGYSIFIVAFRRQLAQIEELPSVDICSYFKLPGTDFIIFPVLLLLTGDEAGRNMRM